MRGKRKGRGGKKGTPALSDIPTDSPKRKDSRLEFHGHLSHASPPITNFFQPQPKDLTPTIKNELSSKTEEVDEPILITEKRNSVEQVPLEKEMFHNATSLPDQTPVESLPIVPNGQESVDDIGRSQSPVTPHKMILHEDAPPPLVTSPSNALSLLSIANGVLKKTTKSRRKLNPNQTSNQLAPASTTSKLHCCTKTKSAPVNEAKPPSVPASSNGSQAKLTEFFPVRRSVRKTKKTVLEERQRTLEEAVMMCKEEGLQVHHFEGKGRGIVAVRAFAKGEFVVEYAGELIKMDEAREREKLYAQDQNTGCYMYYFKYKNQQFCVDATPESKRLGRLVNHSRNGNLLTKTIAVDNVPRLVLIAKEDIQPGEEVTYDYGDRSKESLKYHPWLAS